MILTVLWISVTAADVYLGMGPPLKSFLTYASQYVTHPFSMVEWVLVPQSVL